MVVPCLSCCHLGDHKYLRNEDTWEFEYFLTCQKGHELPSPMPKQGFECAEYENKLAILPRTKRSQCAIEIRQD